MHPKLYFFLLALVLSINAILSFYHAGIAKENYQALTEMIAFKSQGARYTREDGDKDRIEMIKVTAALEARIKELESKCKHND